MTEDSVKTFLACYKQWRPPEIYLNIVGTPTATIKEDLKNGFIEETLPIYVMARNFNRETGEEEMTTVSRRRFVPTKIGLEYLKFKLL